jgi:hypothetical protein
MPELLHPRDIRPEQLDQRVVLGKRLTVSDVFFFFFFFLETTIFRIDVTITSSKKNPNYSLVLLLDGFWPWCIIAIYTFYSNTRLVPW